MSRVLNITAVVAILWVILHGVWNIATRGDYATTELQEVQLWEGILALAVGIGMLAIFLKVVRKRS